MEKYDMIGGGGGDLQQYNLQSGRGQQRPLS